MRGVTRSAMVQITSSAAEILQQQRDEQSIPDAYGVRLYAAKGADNDRFGIAMGFALDPAEGDEVTEEHGTRLFVAREVAGVLADARLDAASDTADTGEGSPRLVLRKGGDSRP
jgi:Fe-S cluster assembly iron-binding protein IscA